MLVQIELNEHQFASWQRLQQQTGQRDDDLFLRMINEYAQEYSELAEDIVAAREDIAQGRVYTVEEVQIATQNALKDK